jgi:hypothetical protein
MLGGFARTINHLWKSPSKLAVMVYACETQVLERHVPKFFDCLLDTEFACLDPFKNRF